MAIAANCVVVCIGLLHLYTLVLEMFWWTKERGLKAFGNTLTYAQSTRVLAANQGLYNGFLAAGLFWGVSGFALGGADSASATAVKVFFLLCVAIAGVYGAMSASRKILYIQTLPAALALMLVWLASRG